MPPLTDIMDKCWIAVENEICKIDSHVTRNGGTMARTCKYKQLIKKTKFDFAFTNRTAYCMTSK